MKVLFLDIDGVLNSEESFVRNHEAREDAAFKHGEAAGMDKRFLWPLGHLSEPLVDNLNMIVEVNSCNIVISSTWRIGNTHEQIANYLQQKGFLYGYRIIDRTGQDSKNGRGAEIKAWLDANTNVSQYAILDDDSEDIIGDHTTCKHPNNFVKTDFMWGLQEEQVTKVVHILNEHV